MKYKFPCTRKQFDNVTNVSKRNDLSWSSIAYDGKCAIIEMEYYSEYLIVRTDRYRALEEAFIDAMQ